MDVQVYDDEARFFLYWQDRAQKEKIKMTHLIFQGNIVGFVPQQVQSSSPSLGLEIHSE